MGEAIGPINPRTTPHLKVPPVSTVSVWLPDGPSMVLSVIVKIPAFFIVNVPPLLRPIFPLLFLTSAPVISIF